MIEECLVKTRAIKLAKQKWNEAVQHSNKVKTLEAAAWHALEVAREELHEFADQMDEHIKTQG